MYEHPQLPGDDRSPSDGELFSIESLYYMQTEEFRHRHARDLDSRILKEKRIMRYISQELALRHGDDHEPFPDDSFWLWRGEVRDWTDDQLIDELKLAEDTILRALGNLTLTVLTPFGFAVSATSDYYVNRL